MIAIIDYGVGNLYSLAHSLQFLGLACRVTREAAEIERAQRLILPGVGAFGDAMDKLTDSKLAPLIRARAQAGIPLLGICLGMQLLFDKSYEYGEHRGLGLIPGDVCPLRPDIPGALKVPQMGWNQLDRVRPHPLLCQVRPGDCVYYVHSYYAKGCEDFVLASSRYGVEVPGLVARGSVAGAQFHPEKSGDVGLGILSAFARWKGEDAC